MQPGINQVILRFCLKIQFLANPKYALALFFLFSFQTNFLLQLHQMTNHNK